MHWLPLLLMRARYVKQVDSDLMDARSRVHRLEIDLAELRETVHALGGRHDSLSASVRGRLGGRGHKAPILSAGATQAVPDDLNEIPPGDKRALRAYFKLHPPAKEQ
jgi:hypothetical protein